MPGPIRSCGYSSTPTHFWNPAGDLIRGEIDYTKIVGRFGPAVAAMLSPVARLARLRTGRAQLPRPAFSH